jgi:glycosyltransferase involved in cell wall biosynthesis
MDRTWLIITGDFTRSGGMDRANYHLAWHLADRLGHTVHLAAYRVAEPLATHPNVRVHSTSRPLGSQFLGEFALRRLGRRLAQQLTSVDPGVRVIVNGGNCSWPDINWVHIVHNACECRDDDAPWWFRLRNRMALQMDRRQERKVLQNSRLLLANSEKTRRDLIELVAIDPERVKVVYLGVDTAEFAPVTAAEGAAARQRLQLGADDTVLAFVGALGYDHRKGFDTLLDALCVLRDRHFHARVLAAGGGKLAYWQSRIDRRGLTDHVRLLGHVENITSLLAAADLLVSPTHFDSYGLAIHEALCRGVPAIVTRTAGIAERFPPELGELLLNNPNDGTELALRIETWRRRAPVFAAAAQHFGAQLRSWTWDDMAARMVECSEAARTSAIPATARDFSAARPHNQVYSLFFRSLGTKS